MSWAERARSCLLALFLGSPGACGPASVDARAVWLDVMRNDGQSRTVHVYDRGAERAIEISGVPADRPYVPLALGPTGAGVVVRGPKNTVKYVELSGGRMITVREDIGSPAVPESFQFVTRGDALVWHEQARFRLLPVAEGVRLAADGGGGDGSVAPLEVPRLSATWWVSARAAPIVVVFDDVSTGKTRRLVALRYPDHAADRHELTEIGQWSFDSIPNGPRSDAAMRTSCSELARCGGDVALAPDGTEIVYRATDFDAECAWWSWRWRDTAGPRCLDLPEELRDAGLVGVVGQQRYVFVSDEAVHLWRHGTLVSSLAVAGGEHHVRIVDAGRQVVVAATVGPVLTVTGERIRVVNITQTSCQARQSPLVSPRGQWLAWTCEADPDLPTQLSQGAVVRVSSAGLDRFEGVPMQALAVDDEGTVLLYSYSPYSDPYSSEDLGRAVPPDATTPVPRTLFSLTSDDVLDRIDDLEPTPDEVVRPDTLEASHIQAAALP